jgi:hypothetical protein
MADYKVENHGSVFIITAQDDLAWKNLLDGVSSEEVQHWGFRGIVVEPRYVEGLVDQLQEEGWVVE